MAIRAAQILHHPVFSKQTETVFWLNCYRNDSHRKKTTKWTKRWDTLIFLTMQILFQEYNYSSMMDKVLHSTPRLHVMPQCDTCGAKPTQRQIRQLSRSTLSSMSSGGKKTKKIYKNIWIYSVFFTIFTLLSAP